MNPADSVSVDGGAGDSDQEVDSNLAGDTGKRRRYNYAKCSTCRERKKKCEPPDREWPRKCNRCTSLGLPCSAPEDIREKSATTSHALSPRTENAKISKQLKPQKMSGLTSAGLTQGPEGLVLASPTRQAPPPFLSLCECCQQLGLSRSRFLIPARSWKGSFGRSSTRFASPVTGAESTIQSQRFFLGSLSDIRDRARLDRCNFCYLALQAAEDQVILARKEPGDLDMSLSVYATWEIDGRELVHFDKDTDFFQPVTRHIRLSWESSDWLKESYVVLRGDDKKIPGQDQAFLGREIQPTQSLEKIAATTKAWVEDCNDRHERCSSIPSARLVEDVHLRVVDIHDGKLVPLVPFMDYVVLSYTWDPPVESFLKANCKEDWYSGRLREIQAQFPRTIQDTMKLISHLGVRYLWTDSLCIVQDEEEDKQANYSAMDTIFANASLTICAITGTTTATKQHIRNCGDKMSLMVHHPAETHIQSSQWFKGAWTCQDRILSGRCLIFTTSRVWFQCQEESMSEDTFEPSFQGRSADWVQSPAQIWGELTHKASRFRAYIKCVESYTSRQLPQTDHALRAFEGISHFLGMPMQTRFFSGLPSSYFDAAILWTPASGTSYPRKHSGKSVAPSWSWASWTGQATYRPPILTGAVENIWDWLMAHTWISWFLADCSGKILGEIGTFAKSDLPDMADGREKRVKDINTRFIPTVRPKNSQRWPSRKRAEFSRIVPATQPDRMDTDGPQEPPYYLQFWTWSAFLRLGVTSHAVGSRIRRYSILDRNDDICGSIVLPNEFANRADNDLHQEVFQFIATSDARIFFEEEMPEWTYYIPKERHDSSWDLWHVILLETDEDGLSRRVGVGKVFKDAFHQSFPPGMDWREFILV